MRALGTILAGMSLAMAMVVLSAFFIAGHNRTACLPPSARSVEALFAPCLAGDPAPPSTVGQAAR